MTFPERLVFYRNKKGLSQKELAELLSITSARLSNWETGKREPDVQMIKSLSEALDVSSDELIGNSMATKKEAPEPGGSEAVSIEEIEALIPLLVRAGYIRDRTQLTKEDFLFINQLLDLADTWFSRER